MLYQTISIANTVAGRYGEGREVPKRGSGGSCRLEHSRIYPKSYRNSIDITFYDTSATHDTAASSYTKVQTKDKRTGKGWTPMRKI